MEDRTRAEVQSSKGIILYKGKAELFVPKQPKIPLSEGLHIQVSGEHDATDTPKQVLQRAFFGLEAAKVIAESRFTPQEPWANTRIEKGQVVSVYGRNAVNPDSWRKPVNTSSRNVGEIDSIQPAYDQARLVELFRRYSPRWERLEDAMTLFDGGVNGEDVQPVQENGYTVWRSATHNVVIIKDPHLRGFHLVVNPNERIVRQWQTVKETQGDVENQVMVQRYIQSTLEATAIALGIQQLLAPGKGEIHNSGNWAKGLKKTMEEGKLSMNYLSMNPKAEKKIHRPDLSGASEDFGTEMHAHVYIPEDLGADVVLPPMSKGEALERAEAARSQGQDDTSYKSVIAQWEEIPQTSDEQTKLIQERIGNNHLTTWLQENCAGPLRPKIQ